MEPKEVGDKVLVLACAGSPKSRHNRHGEVIGLEPLTIRCARRIVVIADNEHDQVLLLPKHGGGNASYKSELAYR